MLAAYKLTDPVMDCVIDVDVITSGNETRWRYVRAAILPPIVGS